MKLMLAVELSDQIDEVIEKAVTWAEPMGATIDLVHVDEYQYTAFLVREPSVRQVVLDQWENIREHNQAEVKALSAKLPESVRGQSIYLAGRALDTLVETSQRYDGVIVATHGRRGLGRFFLGSVAEQLIRNIDKPVLVLHLSDK